MKYRISVNPTITEWENDDPYITVLLTRGYRKLLLDNGLSPYEYTPVLSWYYNDGDFAKNRITLILEAVPIIVIEIQRNYKDFRNN